MERSGTRAEAVVLAQNKPSRPAAAQPTATARASDIKLYNTTTIGTDHKRRVVVL